MEAKRRRLNDGAAIGPSLSCPDPNCDGCFSLDKLRNRQDGSENDAINLRSSSDEIDGVPSSVEGIEKVASSSLKGTCDVMAERPSSSRVIVTPIIDKVKSGQNDNDLHVKPDAVSSNIKSAVFKYDTDEYSRFSESSVSDHEDNTNFKKEETDEESSHNDGIGSVAKAQTQQEESDDESRFSEGCDEHSRFSDTSEVNKNRVEDEPKEDKSSDENELESDSKEYSNNSSGETGLESEVLEDNNTPGVKVKEEQTYHGIHKKQAKESRKYGDRVLLARQSKIGV